MPLWLVGGAIRDAALGLAGKDVDLVCGPGTRRLVAELQKSFGTRGFRVRKRGVTTWRFDGEDGPMDLVDASRRGLEADLRRRELTINAMAYDLAARKLVDPLGGLPDLRAGRLRAPRREVLAEDPVRALRLARFIAQYPWMRIHRQTRAAATAVAPRLRRASAERLRDELLKLLRGKAPHTGLIELERLGLLPSVLPELVPLQGCAAGFDRPDVWTHTLATLEHSTRLGRLPAADAAARDEDLLVLRFSLLLHDISKPETFRVSPEGKPSFHGHETLGAERADGLLQRLRVSRRTRRRIVRLVRFHLRPGNLADSGPTPRGMARLARDTGDDLGLLILHAACDARGSGAGSLGAADARRRWRRLRELLHSLDGMRGRTKATGTRPLLDGSEVMRLLGWKPGPAIGRALEELLQAQIEGKIRDPREAREHLLKHWTERDGAGGGAA
ncbi:hypothetical protein ABI59_04820 [Acidobacteria bacterium Mor1]|nr:hypothetical protein ABI59_04820 [Acidobacteria bacterium Mor1]